MAYNLNQIAAEWARQAPPGLQNWAVSMARVALRESGGKANSDNSRSGPGGTKLNRNGTVDTGAYAVNDIWRSDPVIGPLFRSGAIRTLAGSTKAAIRIMQVQGPSAWRSSGADPTPTGSVAPGPAPHARGGHTTTTTTGGGTNIDAAIMDALASDHGLGGLGHAVLANLTSGRYDTPATTTTTQTPANRAASAAGSAANPTATGTTTFDGKPVAKWIVHALRYARANGWTGTVSSGFRTDAEQTAIYKSGVRPAAVPKSLGGSGSNHEGAVFPLGAVDVTNASQLSSILQRSPYASQLIWAGSKDPVHFSHPHNGGY